MLCQFSDTGGETKPVSFFDSEFQLLGVIIDNMPTNVGGITAFNFPTVADKELSSQATGDTKVLKTLHQESPS